MDHVQKSFQQVDWGIPCTFLEGKFGKKSIATDIMWFDLIRAVC